MRSSTAGTSKGEARRDALLDAAQRVLAQSGVGAVTHRAVAREAGLSLSSATYYFATIDELLVSALRRATLDQVATLRALHDAPLRDFASTLHGWATTERAITIAQYELIFLAMRRDSMRTDAELWYDALEAAIDPERLHGARTRVTALAIDGLLLRMLWLGDPATINDTELALRQIVGRDAT